MKEGGREGQKEGSARGRVHWGCDYAKPKRNESDLLLCDGIPVALKCASVSRWACRKRRSKNSPCMRVEVVTMAGRKEMF